MLIEWSLSLREYVVGVFTKTISLNINFLIKKNYLVLLTMRCEKKICICFLFLCRMDTIPPYCVLVKHMGSVARVLGFQSQLYLLLSVLPRRRYKIFLYYCFCNRKKSLVRVANS